MARARPTEVKLVADHLERAFQYADTDDGELELDDLARDLLEALDETRSQRSMYAAMCAIPVGDVMVWCGYGPYSTPKQARSAMLAAVAPGPLPGAGRVIQLKREVPS